MKYKTVEQISLCKRAKSYMTGMKKMMYCCIADNSTIIATMAF